MYLIFDLVELDLVNLNRWPVLYLNTIHASTCPSPSVQGQCEITPSPQVVVQSSVSQQLPAPGLRLSKHYASHEPD